MHQQNNDETKLETPNCDNSVIVVKKYIPGLIFGESAKEALRTSLHKTQYGKKRKYQIRVEKERSSLVHQKYCFR